MTQTTPLGYAASSSSTALPSHIRALPLLVPNLMALSVLFLPLLTNEPPILPAFKYAAHLIRLRQYPPRHITWEAMITGPFLLAIPLALWTIRLSLAPRPRRIERIIAWSLSLVSLLMTMLCMGYCVSISGRRFWPAIVAGMVMLVIGLTGVGMLRRLRHTWPVALLAMTAAWTVNATLTIFVIRTHAPWSAGIVATIITIVAQLVAGIVCTRRWHGVTSA